MQLLDNLRVLDFTTFVQGPAATLALADMGADVIKVEAPDGDTLRSYGLRDDGFSGPFESLNRSKRSIVLDLREPAARGAVDRLLETTDVLALSFRPKTTKRLGLDYETLAPRFPRLIHVSATGYGVDGPDAGEPSFDIVAGGRSGYLVATGRPEGEPRRPLSPMGDLLAAKDTTNAVLLALLARERTGRGQRVTTSLLASQIAFQRMGFTEYFYDGSLGGISHRDGSALSTWYRTSDGGWIVISLLHPRFYSRLCRLLERTELEADPRFVDTAARAENDAVLRSILDECFATRTRDEWVRRLRDADVPGGPVLDLPEVVADAHVEAQNLWTDYEHPRFGTVRSVNSGVQLSEFPFAAASPAPALGEHTADVLAAVGCTPDEIAAISGAST